MKLFRPFFRNTKTTTNFLPTNFIRVKTYVYIRRTGRQAAVVPSIIRWGELSPSWSRFRSDEFRKSGQQHQRRSAKYVPRADPEDSHQASAQPKLFVMFWSLDGWRKLISTLLRDKAVGMGFVYSTLVDQTKPDHHHYSAEQRILEKLPANFGLSRDVLPLNTYTHTLEFPFHILARCDGWDVLLAAKAHNGWLLEEYIIIIVILDMSLVTYWLIHLSCICRI